MLYLNGEWTPTATSAPVHSPWDGSEVSRYPLAEPEHVETAVAGAVAALAARPPAHQRAAVLREVARIMEAEADDLAQCVCAEAGKPITSARAEVARTIDTLWFSAEAARGLGGTTVPMDATAAGTGLIGFELSEPRGVVAAVTPFNFPLNLVAHKVGPAIAAGCPVILKPSEHTPLSAQRLVAAFDRAGCPTGMLQLVTGDPQMVVGALVDDPRVAVLTFTGSSAVGWALRAQAPHKHTILELGSNTALVVTETANLDHAATAALTGGFTYAGQACVSVQRVYVQASVEDQFVSRLASAAQALPAGDPADESTVVGPMISRAAADRISGWIDAAVRGGAILRAGGGRDGNVVPATILSRVDEDATIMCAEAFAPVVCINPYTDLDEAIDLVNRSQFGLNTAIFTSDLADAMAYAARAEAGTVLVNVSPSFRVDHMPYGGVKHSGHGREGVPYAVREYLSPKLVVLAS